MAATAVELITLQVTQDQASASSPAEWLIEVVAQPNMLSTRRRPPARLGAELPRALEVWLGYSDYGLACLAEMHLS
ncbi:unnamed protein product [Arctogadus glacialis]